MRIPNDHPAILEFWATWCGPCIAQIPHLNQVTSNYKPDQLTVVWISPETKSAVRDFLASHRIQGSVLTDEDGQIFKAYGAGMPCTVLLDREGRVLRKVHPSQISREVVEDLVAGRPIRLSAFRDNDFPSQVGGPFVEPTGTANQNAVEVRVAPSQTVGGMITAEDPGTNSVFDLKADGEELDTLLGFAFGVSKVRVILPEALKGGFYNVRVRVPIEQARMLKPLLQNALEAAFNFHARTVMRRMEAIELSGFPGKLKRTEVGTPASHIVPGNWQVESLPIASLGALLESMLGRPVVLHEPMAGNFAWTLGWKANNAEDLLRAVQEDLGLTLVKRSRILELVVTTSSAPNASAR